MSRDEAERKAKIRYEYGLRKSKIKARVGHLPPSPGFRRIPVIPLDITLNVIVVGFTDE